VRQLIDRCGNAIKSVISGFDRIMFKGHIRRLMFPDGAMGFLAQRGIRNKDFKPWVQEQTDQLVAAVEQRCQAATGHGITKLTNSTDRKETLVRERQAALGITSGIIGAWSCVEAGQSYRSTFSREHGFPQLRPDWVRCKHLYLYMDDPLYGLVGLRLQTWFPYHLQISMNGREWLRRQLDAAGIGYARVGNKFLDIEHTKRAQRLLDKQCGVDWTKLLNRFVPIIFPHKGAIIGPDVPYYWTCWQSEWATDFIGPTTAWAEETMAMLMQYAFHTGTADRVLRYLDKPLRADGRPYANLTDEVLSRVTAYTEGLRVRHSVGRNSVKAYNQYNILRIEATINDPSAFTVMRPKQTPQPGATSELVRQQLRKGVCDLARRAEVSRGITARFEDHLAACDSTTVLEELLEPCGKRSTKQGRAIRALEVFGKDRDLIRALADHAHSVEGITNTSLRKALHGSTWAKGRTDKQLTARISRHIRMLRDHGIIRKMPNQRRYQLTPQGRDITTALTAALRISTKELMKHAA
jgi:hypothetical protein